MRLLLTRFGSCRRCRSMASRTRARMSARRFRSSLTAEGARTISNRIWPDYSQTCPLSLAHRLALEGEHDPSCAPTAAFRPRYAPTRRPLTPLAFRPARAEGRHERVLPARSERRRIDDLLEGLDLKEW